MPVSSTVSHDQGMTTEVSMWLTALVVLLVATISKCEICSVLRNIDLI
jgi:hypothetical protein